MPFHRRRARDLLVVVGLLSGLVGGPIPSAPAQQGTIDWPMIGRDAGHSGSADGPSAPYREAWREPVGLGGPVAGPVATSRAVVVIAARGVIALDPVSGERLWSFPRSAGPAGPAAIAGDSVIHSSGRGTNVALIARALVDGQPRWRAFLGGEAAGGVVIGDGVVYVGTKEGDLLGFDVHTGRERFRIESAGELEGPVAFADDLVLAAWEEPGAGRATVRAFESGSEGGQGAPAWQLTVGPGGLPTASVAVRGRTAFVAGGDGTVQAVDLSTGATRWVRPLRDVADSAQVPAAGPSLVVADRLHVSRLDPQSGEERWAFRLADLRPIGAGEFDTLSASSPVVSGRAVLIGDAIGRASAIDVRTGRLVWRSDLGPGAVSTLAVGTENVYAAVLGPDGAVVALHHDPEGRVLNETSETVLDPFRALLNFAAAAAVVFALVVAVFRYALGGRRPPEEARA